MTAPAINSGKPTSYKSFLIDFARLHLFPEELPTYHLAPRPPSPTLRYLLVTTAYSFPSAVSHSKSQTHHHVTFR
jgi:hypothetical protein